LKAQTYIRRTPLNCAIIMRSRGPAAGLPKHTYVEPSALQSYHRWGLAAGKPHPHLCGTPLVALPSICEVRARRPESQNLPTEDAPSLCYQYAQSGPSGQNALTYLRRTPLISAISRGRRLNARTSLRKMLLCSAISMSGRDRAAGSPNLPA
jgi:hypothetical protein